MVDEALTDVHRAANHATWRHIHRVQELLLGGCKQLMDRALRHDQSKLVLPEVEGFSSVNLPQLQGVTYGSAEYDEVKQRVLGDALAHHYANNSHHPEHFARGIRDMTLLDLLEMFYDWKAASERHADGNIRTSIAINAKRFGMPLILQEIFENTIATLDRS